MFYSTHPCSVQSWFSDPSSIPIQLRQWEYNCKSTLFSGTVYCIKICVYFFLETRGSLVWGGVILHPGLNYEDIIYMKWPKLITVAKCPGCNNFFSCIWKLKQWKETCLTGFFLPLVHHFYIHWDLSTKYLLVMNYIFFTFLKIQTVPSKPKVLA